MKRRFHWGAGVALLYTAFVSATLAFVIFALANPAALVSVDYYNEARQHDRRIEATANGRAAGTTVRMERDAMNRPVATLVIEAAAHNRPAGTIHWYRPSDAASDRTIALDVDALGRQQMPVDGLAAGHWRVKVAWEADGRPFYFETAVMVRP